MNSKMRKLNVCWPEWNRCDYSYGESLPDIQDPEYNIIMIRAFESLPEDELRDLVNEKT